MIEQRKRNRGQGGFTLIELLVVIAILAILAGVAVFAVGNLTTGAAENACKLEKDTIRTAAQASIAKNGSDTNYANYLDGTTKYWTYTPTNSATAAVPAAKAPKNPAPGDCSTAIG
jgi:type IV pilus assembly protein PilA